MNRNLDTCISSLSLFQGAWFPSSNIVESGTGAAGQGIVESNGWKGYSHIDRFR